MVSMNKCAVAVAMLTLLMLLASGGHAVKMGNLRGFDAKNKLQLEEEETAAKAMLEEEETAAKAMLEEAAAKAEEEKAKEKAKTKSKKKDEAPPNTSHEDEEDIATNQNEEHLKEFNGAWIVTYLPKNDGDTLPTILQGDIEVTVKDGIVTGAKGIKFGDFEISEVEQTGPKTTLKVKVKDAAGDVFQGYSTDPYGEITWNNLISSQLQGMGVKQITWKKNPKNLDQPVALQTIDEKSKQKSHHTITINKNSRKIQKSTLSHVKEARSNRKYERKYYESEQQKKREDTEYDQQKKASQKIKDARYQESLKDKKEKDPVLAAQLAAKQKAKNARQYQKKKDKAKTDPALLKSLKEKEKLRNAAYRTSQKEKKN